MSKVIRLTGPASLRELEERVRNYQPTQAQLNAIERAFRLGPPNHDRRKSVEIILNEPAVEAV